MATSDLKQKTARSFLWGGISSGAEQLASVVFGICLARILTPDDYGLVGMLAIFNGIAASMMSGGFFVALVNKQDATQKDYDAVFWFSALTGLLLYAALFFSAPLIARFFGRPELVSLARVLFIAIFLGGIAAVPVAIMFKHLMAKEQATISIVSLLASGLTGVSLALGGYAYWALVAQNVVLMGLGFALRFFYIPWRPSLKIDLSPLKGMLGFSSKLLITGIFSCVSGNIFSVLLGKFYNATQLAFFSQGQKWMVIGQQFINGMFNLVSQPVLVQIQEERERQVNVLRKMIRFGAFLSFPLMLGLAFIAEEFIVVVVGDKWLPSVPFLQLFCLWGAVAFLWNLFVNVIYTHEKSDIYMYVSIAVGLLQLAVVASMYRFGIFPMVMGYVATNFAGLLICQHYVRRLTGLRLRDVLKDVLPYLLITTGCLLAAWLATRNVENLYLLIGFKIMLSGGLYVFALLIGRSTILKESMEFFVRSVRKQYKILLHQKNKTEIK
jgi:O-antigen/teichoic acid export membrane protein